ncbi:hypothetical protein MLD38_026033 [Melastoma candidum]|uniref:Uncharacterized protein n=1 Tax=Melastoma candidum TaxID=119954 RepID=A0ACB9NY80_9MYRT|nr:hypothetical protein MLD38_026033 [Melastoma candidum]
MRGRSYSYSPSPPRGYSRRNRSPSPRGYYRGDGRDLPTSLLVRNLRLGCRSLQLLVFSLPEDLRGPFGQFGPIKDVYLPQDYHTGEPRGFGFVQYAYPEGAEEAKHYMDRQILLGREITVVFAEENRKKPSEMRARERGRGRRSPLRYSRSQRYRRSYSRSPSYDSLERRRYSRSISPAERRRRGRSYLESLYGSRRRSRSRSSDYSR